MIKTSPITAFIHVPKTAGSTINYFLQKHNGAGQSHIEAWTHQERGIVKSNLKSLEWVSGHVPFPTMRAMLAEGTFRRLDFFTVMRNPVEQIASHYNWLIEIFHKGEEFYYNHPPLVKAISNRIRETDNSNPVKIKEQLLLAPKLFLNQQTKIVLGSDFGGMGAFELRDRLSVYVEICTEHGLSDLIRKLTSLIYTEKERKNASRYHFPKEVFQDPLLQSFLKVHHSADLILYDFVREYEIRKSTNMSEL